VNITRIQKIYDIIAGIIAKEDKKNLAMIVGVFLFLIFLIYGITAVKTVLSTAAGTLLIIGMIPYVLATIAGETKPAKASWIIWAILDTITFAGMYAEGSLNGHIIGAVIGVWAVVIVAFKYGESGWSGLDKFCLTGAALGIFLWYIFDSPTLGILISLGVTFIAAIPTFVSAWKDPSKEDKTAWAIFFIAASCAIFAIPQITWEDASQPITFWIIESIMIYLLFIRKPTKR